MHLPENNHNFLDNLRPKDLLVLQHQLREFQQTLLFKVFQADYSSARDSLTELICSLTPTTVQDFFAREQAIGQLEQVRIANMWFQSRLEEIDEQVKNIKHEEIE